MNVDGSNQSRVTTESAADEEPAWKTVGSYSIKGRVVSSGVGFNADQLTANFVATLKSYAISGVVKVGTTALPGVTMKLTSPAPAGFSPRTVQTNTSGIYTFPNLPAGRTYTLTPAKTGYTFTPLNRTVNNLSGNVAPGSSTNFTGVQ
ncbi:MAG TPA: carboxypeptidase-like regulatory domain-containing protein [Pyrinomonadaceae bacterium]|nr:carboxypeptidase-like regulatory domain-containing protein [Pyrinomonadaceae bacterium]